MQKNSVCTAFRLASSSIQMSTDQGFHEDLVPCRPADALRSTCRASRACLQRTACSYFALYMQGQLCVLAEDCDQPDYKKLVEALCSEHNVSLLSVPEAKQLGQWAGVSSLGSMLCVRNHSISA